MDARRKDGCIVLTKFALKMVLNGFILSVLVYWYADIPYVNALAAALAFMAAAWFIGDLWLLRKANNAVATVADAGLTFAYLWAAAAFFRWDLTFDELLVIALFVGFAEWFFHRYIMSVDKVTL